jgi:hypothetical protein
MATDLILDLMASLMDYFVEARPDNVGHSLLAVDFRRGTAHTTTHHDHESSRGNSTEGPLLPHDHEHNWIEPGCPCFFNPYCPGIFRWLGMVIRKTGAG